MRQGPSTTIDARAAEEAPAALVGVTPDGLVAHWNRSAEILFGFARDEAVGQALVELIVPPSQVDESRTLLQDAARGQARSRDTVRRCRDGSLIYVHIEVRALRGADGALEGYLNSHADVTHLKVERDARLIESRYRDLLES